MADTNNAQGVARTNGAPVSQIGPSTSTNIVTEPVVIGNITSFRWDRYVHTGRSFGNVYVAQGNRGEVWFGTDNRVFPVLDHGVVKLGKLPYNRNRDELTEADVAEGKEVVLITERTADPRGERTVWCFVDEWNAAIELLREKLIAWELAAEKSAMQAELAKLRADRDKERGYIEVRPRPLMERIVDGMVMADLLRSREGGHGTSGRKQRGNGRPLKHRSGQ